MKANCFDVKFPKGKSEKRDPGPSTQDPAPPKNHPRSTPKAPRWASNCENVSRMLTRAPPEFDFWRGQAIAHHVNYIGIEALKPYSQLFILRDV